MITLMRRAIQLNTTAHSSSLVSKIFLKCQYSIILLNIHISIPLDCSTFSFYVLCEGYPINAFFCKLSLPLILISYNQAFYLYSQIYKVFIHKNWQSVWHSWLVHLLHVPVVLASVCLSPTQCQGKN